MTRSLTTGGVALSETMWATTAGEGDATTLVSSGLGLPADPAAAAGQTRRPDSQEQ